MDLASSAASTAQHLLLEALGEEDGFGEKKMGKGGERGRASGTSGNQDGRKGNTAEREKKETDPETRERNELKKKDKDER